MARQAIVGVVEENERQCAADFERVRELKQRLEDKEIAVLALQLELQRGGGGGGGGAGGASSAAASSRRRGAHSAGSSGKQAGLKPSSANGQPRARPRPVSPPPQMFSSGSAQLPGTRANASRARTLGGC